MLVQKPPVNRRALFVNAAEGSRRIDEGYEQQQQQRRNGQWRRSSLGTLAKEVPFGNSEGNVDDHPACFGAQVIERSVVRTS